MDTISVLNIAMEKFLYCLKRLKKSTVVIPIASAVAPIKWSMQYYKYM